MSESKNKDEKDFSDFDNSDEDLASLLADDEDDIFSKKQFSSSNKSNLKTQNSNKKQSDSPPVTLSRQPSTNKTDVEGDALNDLLADSSLPSFLQKSRSNSIVRSSSHDDGQEISSTSDKKVNPTSKKKPSLSEAGNESDDDDILKSLGSDKGSPRKRSGSFFDDFLKTLSPKKTLEKEHVNKQKAVTNDAENDKNDFETDSNKKKDTPKITSIERKRQNFTKQVSFKDLPDSPFDEPSPSKEKQPVPISSEPPDTPTKFPLKSGQPKRSKRMGASKADDTDWLNYFKESPKKSSKPQSDTKRKDSIPSSDFIANRRRRSSAEWLGLSEREDAEANENQQSPAIKRRTPRSQTAPLRQSGRQQQQFNLEDMNWLGSGGNKSEPSQPLQGSDGIISAPKDEQAKLVSQLSLENLKRTTVPVPPQKEVVTMNSEAAASPVMEHAVSSTKNLNPAAVLASDYALQTILSNHALEKDQLIKSTEAIKALYEERINTMEALYKKEIKLLEKSAETSEAKFVSDIADKIKQYEEKLQAHKSEQDSIEKRFTAKIQTLEKENQQEIERLKELYNRTITTLKQDHEDALQRLNRFREQEIEAVLSAHSQSKSLQHLTDQLEARTTDLAQLQAKVEERNQITLREKQFLLEAKERELQNLQSRLEKQSAGGDEERHHLQQLVLKLESRLQKSTTEGEEERWEVQQMKSRLTVQQKHLDEEYKLGMQQIEKEKEKMRLAQESLLHEQKTVLLQLAQERQQIMKEKVDLDVIAKKLKEEETRVHIKKMKEDSYIQKERQFLQQEENRLQCEKNNLKQEAQVVEQMQDALQKERQALHRERATFNEMVYKVRRKESEAEHLAKIAAEERERASSDHNSVLRIQSEQKSKLHEITQKTQILMEKEKNILKEKEELSAQKLQLENMQNNVMCNKCKLSLGFSNNAPPVIDNRYPSTVPVAMLPHLHSQTQPMPSRVDPSLVVWYLTAQRDRDYLQDELAFLKSIKDCSKNK